MDSLGTVGRQNPPVFTNAACDGQTGFVPHGFSEGELRRNREQSFDLDLEFQQIGVLAFGAAQLQLSPANKGHLTWSVSNSYSCSARVQM